MFIAIILSTLLVMLTFYFHYWILMWISRFIISKNRNKYKSISVLITILFLFTAHLAEIGVYAFAYHESVENMGLGTLKGLNLHETISYLYFSCVTYTSLGVSDIYPEGYIRVIAGIETLNGLLLIGWSASYTFLIMKRFWSWE